MVRGYQWRVVGLRGSPAALKIFVAFSKNGNVQEKYLSSL